MNKLGQINQPPFMTFWMYLMDIVLEKTKLFFFFFVAKKTFGDPPKDLKYLRQRELVGHDIGLVCQEIGLDFIKSQKKNSQN
jgi:hypothetical protein